VSFWKARHPAVLEPDGDVAGDGAPREHRVLLEDVADLGRHPAGHADAVDLHPPGARRDKAAEHVEDGGLAAARGAHDGHELPVEDLERDVLDGGDRPVAVAKCLGEITEHDAGTAGGHGGAPTMRGGRRRRSPAGRIV